MKFDGPEERWSPYTDLIIRTECLKGNGKEMIIAGDFSVLFSLRSAAASATEAAQADVYSSKRGATVSVTVTSQVAQWPLRHGIIIVIIIIILLLLLLLLLLNEFLFRQKLRVTVI